MKPGFQAVTDYDQLISADSSNSVVPISGITSQSAVLHSAELCRSPSPSEGANNNQDRFLLPDALAQLSFGVPGQLVM